MNETGSENEHAEKTSRVTTVNEIKDHKGSNPLKGGEFMNCFDTYFVFTALHYSKMNETGSENEHAEKQVE
ncbi:hypothetical protein OUZ56_004986 [Daphnia magna]|uniref:Uncharacterized protein n=1 Tax=Daphnia magna TaxID=35525 RepID=A0ABQ9YRN6_9CRUS|nr:hypothetical protein OUZ56_004986 [Daphnia magna]